MLKTKLKRTVALTVVCASMAALAVGCNNGDEPKLQDGQVLLKISAFNGGYGLDWLDALSAEYMKDNSNVVISYNKTTVDRKGQLTALKSGSADADIYITGAFNLHNHMYDGMKLVDLSDIYEEIGDKIIPSVKGWYEHGGTQYAVPWATSVLGILYHSDFFTENGLKVPRTTNELLNVAQSITDMRKTNATSSYAFCYSANESEGQCYWDYMFYPWMAQYEGKTNYESYWDCKLKDGTQYDKQIVNEYNGILRTLEVYEELLKPSNGYNHIKYSEDSFTVAQRRFLRHEAQMIVDGDWIVQEMKKGNYTEEETKDIAFMKTPIISSIVETMPMWKEADDVRYTADSVYTPEQTALSDAKKSAYEKALVAIIDYVDGITATNPAGTTVEGIAISQDDVARIQDARSIVPSMADNHIMVIPQCSDRIDIAKDFIKFVYSEKGIGLYANSVYGTGLPVNYSEEKITEIVGESKLLGSAYDMLKDNYYLTFYNGGKNAVFSKGGLKPWYRTDAMTFIEAFTQTASSKYETAYKFYSNSQTQILTAWTNLMTNKNY